jgi:flavin-dependent dehydrogenase
VTDVLVVGAGPAGSSAALRLVRAGYDVAILERSSFPRIKVCGEYLSPGACAALADLGLLPIVAREAFPLRRIMLAGFGTEPVSLNLPGDGALSISRSRLDELLLAEARAAGTCVLPGSFLAADELSDRVEVRYRGADGTERRFAARALVGADGAWSTVAQRTGLASHRRQGGRWAVGGHLHGQLDSDALEMYVGVGGYYARNPLGAGRTNAMLVLPQACLGDDAERAVASITSGRRRFESDALEKQVAVGPLRYWPTAVARGRLLLTGDAAGLLDPFVGQGIAIALESSVPVTSAITAMLRGDAKATIARRYAAARRSAVLPRKILAAAVDAFIRTPFLRARAERAIKRNPAPAEAILAAVAGAVPPVRALSLQAIAGLLA